MADLQNKITIVRGPVTIAPDKAWTDAAARWPVRMVTRVTECPAGCLSDHVHGTRYRAHELGVEETAGPVTEHHLACAVCPGEPSVINLGEPGCGFVLCSADMLAAILAHLRRSHPDVV